MKQRTWPLFLSIYLSLNTTPTVYLGPITNLQEKLIAHLSHARQRVWVASYLLTSAPLVRSLIAAHQRGCNVEIIVDATMVQQHRGRQVIAQLRRNGITCFVYHALHANHLMHHKFAVIDTHLWSGSMNWTTAGSRRNHESVIWSNDLTMIRAFGHHFTTLKRRHARMYATTPPYSSLYFIPDHRAQMKSLLLNAIHTAQQRIVLSMYELSERTVLHALLQAHQRGISVSIITDKHTRPVTVLPAQQHADKVCFHHKYAVIDNQVWLGSMNWTQRGMSGNQEVVMVFTQRTVIDPLLQLHQQLLRATREHHPVESEHIKNQLRR